MDGQSSVSSAEPRALSEHPLLAWLLRKRASARLAFILRSISMVAGAGLSLIWARLLLQLMGKELNGLFLTFLAIIQLGGIGDLGVSSAMGVKAMQYLSRGEDEACKRFLSNARGVILVLALTSLCGFLFLAPWLPSWFRFNQLSGAGSLPLLFVAGGLGLALTIVNGYFQTLNYIHGNVVWPVFPAFFLAQLTFAGQLMLAVWHLPLWGQYSWYVILSVVGCGTAWWMLRISHPWLGSLWPVRFEFQEIRALATMSFWSYFGTLGNLLYVTTDRILINAGFGSGPVPAYRFNYKLCELGISFLAAATFVALPGIVQRILHSDSTVRETGVAEAVRVQQLQTFAAGIAGLAFLSINDWFISFWLGPDFRVPLSWQVAFALTFVITIAGDVGIQLLGRLNPSAIRLAGLSVGGTGVLNLILSAIAMRSGSILGIALATVVAQSVASLVMSYNTCRLLRTEWGPWVVRGWAVPTIFVLVGAAIRAQLPPSTITQAMLLAGSYVVLSGGLAVLLGLSREMLVDEWRRIRATFS